MSERITYYGDGQGNWSMRVWGIQCPEEILFSRKCQGVEGHAGDHWCYGGDGSYHYEVRPDDPRRKENAAGMIPPGHKEWINPVEMMDKCYMGFYEDSVVTDPELIARLNSGHLEENESMDLPASEVDR